MPVRQPTDVSDTSLLKTPRDLRSEKARPGGYIDDADAAGMWLRANDPQWVAAKGRPKNPQWAPTPKDLAARNREERKAAWRADVARRKAAQPPPKPKKRGRKPRPTKRKRKRPPAPGLTIAELAGAHFGLHRLTLKKWLDSLGAQFVRAEGRRTKLYLPLSEFRRVLPFEYRYWRWCQRNGKELRAFTRGLEAMKRAQSERIARGETPYRIALE